MKTGLYGGTFDPVHNGHIEIAKAALAQFQLDELWFIPAKIPPHKMNKSITCEKRRLQMLELALEGLESSFQINTCELDRKSTSFTYISLGELKKQFPENDFYFIMGEDSLKDFETWRHPEIISNLANIIVAPRSEPDKDERSFYTEKYKNKFHSEIYFLDMPFIDVSSTRIKERISLDQEIKHLVPDKVYDYIFRNHLYK